MPGPHGLAEACATAYFNHLLADAGLRAALPELLGCVLCCECDQGVACHGDVLIYACSRYLQGSLSISRSRSDGASSSGGTIGHVGSIHAAPLVAEGFPRCTMLGTCLLPPAIQRRFSQAAFDNAFRTLFPADWARGVRLP